MRILVFRTCSLLVALMLVLSSSHSASAQDVSPRWNLQKGQVFDVVMKQDIRQIMRMHGLADQEIPTTQEIDMTWSVADASADEFTLEQTMTRMRMSIRSPMMNMTIDSNEGTPTDSMARQMKESLDRIIGQKMLVRMNRRGAVLAVTLPESITTAANVPGNPISGDTLKGLMQQSSLMFPETALQRGTTWQQTADMGMSGLPMKSTITFTYEGLDDSSGRQAHRVSQRSDMSLGSGPMGLPMTLKSQENTGTLLFDATGGYLSASTARMKMTMEIEAGGQRVEQDIVGDITLAVTPRKP